MNENENEALGYNRRDFLKGGSVATLMTMMGGVELFAQTNAAPAGETCGSLTTPKGICPLKHTGVKARISGPLGARRRTASLAPLAAIVAQALRAFHSPHRIDLEHTASALWLRAVPR